MASNLLGTRHERHLYSVAIDIHAIPGFLMSEGRSTHTANLP